MAHIVMHSSFVTTATLRPGGGRGIVVEKSGFDQFCHGNAGGNTRGLLYIGKKGREMKI